ncbi:MAG: carbohydrate ABC transporter permease [Saccharofermentanales bacterium]
MNRLLSKVLKIRSPQVGSAIWSLVRFVIIFGLCFEIVYPFLVKILQMFMSTADLADPTVHLYPKTFSLDFIRETFQLIEYPSSFLTTLLISLVTSVIQLIICTTAGYGFARIEFKGRNLLFAGVLLSLLIPPAMYSVSLFLRFRYFGLFGLFGTGYIKLIDTLAPYAILSFTGMGLKNGLFIYLMRQFFRGLPKELEQAAYIDGCNVYRTYFSVMMPNARNMMMTIFILSFAWQWTDVFYATLFSSGMQTLSIAILNNIRSVAMDGSTRDGMVYSILRNTGGILTIFPLLAAYALVQKQLIQGVERSGIVG